jgi:hypothetical protein
MFYFRKDRSYRRIFYTEWQQKFLVEYIIFLQEFVLFKKLRKPRYMPTGWPWRKMAQKTIVFCILVNWDKNTDIEWQYLIAYIYEYEIWYIHSLYVCLHIWHVVYVRNIVLKLEITKYLLGLKFWGYVWLLNLTEMKWTLTCNSSNK